MTEQELYRKIHELIYSKHSASRRPLNIPFIELLRATAADRATLHPLLAALLTDDKIKMRPGINDELIYLK